MTNATMDDLEAMATTFKAAGISATVDGSDIVIPLGQSSRQLQALVFMSEMQHNEIALRLDERLRDLLRSLTTYRYHGLVCVIARSPNLERSQDLSNGVVLMSDGDDDILWFNPADFELMDGPELPAVRKLMPDEWKALVDAVGSVRAISEPVGFGILAEMVEGEAPEPIATEEKKAKRTGKNRRDTTNKGRKYERRDPGTPEGDWDPMLPKDTIQKLLTLHSWVAFGVYLTLIREAASRGNCAVLQDKVARVVGCAESAVRKAWRDLERVKLIRQTLEGHQGKKSEFEVYGYVRKGKSRKGASE